MNENCTTGLEVEIIRFLRGVLKFQVAINKFGGLNKFVVIIDVPFFVSNLWKKIFKPDCHFLFGNGSR